VEDASLPPPRIVLETAIGRVEGDLGRDVEALERIVRACAEDATGKEPAR
jgi:hypothetical protein